LAAQILQKAVQFFSGSLAMVVLTCLFLSPSFYEIAGAKFSKVFPTWKG
jgi:hypothetical protein